jgi:2-oxo-4-hydroxy-4-carboxy-5-ureidoimidazoline decarboxylase
LAKPLDEWNRMECGAATEALLHCCAAPRWAHGVFIGRPYETADALYQSADAVWATMGESDWMQAFQAHPRIGESKAKLASNQSSAWSEQEQASVEVTNAAMLTRMAAENRLYEEFFGFTYIVCAIGKAVEEMLSILERRLANDRVSELREAAEQQRQITQIRLRKWLEA